MRCRCFVAKIVALFAVSFPCIALGQLRPQAPQELPDLEQTPQSTPLPPRQADGIPRVVIGEPQLVRLAREKFGNDFTETDAAFFTAVSSNDWADFRPSPETTYDTQEPNSWSASPVIKADRIVWLCNDETAVKLVPSRGIWLRGVNIVGKIELYRSKVPFSLTLHDCLLSDGINIGHAEFQELDIRNSCSAAIQARGIDVDENVYLNGTSVFGGLDLIDAQVLGDFDFSGGLAFHGTTPDDVTKQGLAINLHDAKIGGDLRLGGGFRALGQVRLIGTQIGRSLNCDNGQFNGIGQTAIDAPRCQIAATVSFTNGFRAEGGVEMRRTRIGGDLDCDGGRFVASNIDALAADLVHVGGQVHLGDGFHAEGEVRLINAVVAGDIDCDNGHFLHPDGDSLSLDGAVIGRSLRIGANGAVAAEDQELPAGFLARGTLRLWDTQVKQDILASGGQFDTPAGTAILACNVRVGSRVMLTGVTAHGTINLFAADIEHELDLRYSHFDGSQAPNQIAVWANAVKVGGHLFCNEATSGGEEYRLRANGLVSFQFATIGMHWELGGAELSNPGGDALDASDCRVGGYVNVDAVKVDGRVSFSRAKIDGLWIIQNIAQSDRFWLDLRFAHIWVIKDQRLDDWPPAGQLQLEGLVYDHFDDDSPLGVEDRLEWLRRQYAPHAATVATAAPQAPPSEPSAALRRGRSMSLPISDKMAVRSHIVPTAYEPESDTPAETMVAPSSDMAAPAIDESSAPPAMSAPSSDETPPAILGDSALADDEEATAESEELVAMATEDPQITKPIAADPAGRRYITQPYTQLASVYRAIGQDEQANAVLVARAERIGELSPILSAHGLWYRYFGRLIGYGYEPFRAIKIGLGIILLGTVVFAIGSHRNLMAETKLAENVLSQEGERPLVSPAYPRFNPIIYSLDVFLPFVDLHQICYWIPGERPSNPRTSRNCLLHVGRYSLKWSAVLRAYLWFQTLAGWTLCTLLAAAVTGIVES